MCLRADYLRIAAEEDLDILSYLQEAFLVPKYVCAKLVVRVLLFLILVARSCYKSTVSAETCFFRCFFIDLLRNHFC